MSRQSWMVLGGLGCGGLLLVVVLCGSGGYLLFRTASASQAEISAEVDALLSAAHDGDFEDTYLTSTTPEFQKATTAAQYQQIGEGIARLGALKSKTPTRFFVSQKNAKTTADVSYRAEFEHGPATIHVKVQKVGRKWKLVGININSPLFTQDIATLTCPNCDGAYSPSAKFCPHCGKPVPEKAEQEPEGDRQSTASKPSI